MKGMSIKLKVSLVLAGALVLIFGIQLVISSNQQEEIVATLYDQNISELQWSLAKTVESIMVSGENEKLQPLAERALEKEVAQEVTIVDAAGIITRSSDGASVGNRAADSEWSRVLSDGSEITLEKEINGEPMVVSYKAFSNEEACQDCHDIEEEKILGGMKLVKSKAAMKEQLAGGFNSLLMLSVVAVIVLIGVIYFTIRREIFSCMANVQKKLQRAAAGDIDQDIVVDSNNEVGRMMASVRDLLEYIKGFSRASSKIADGDLRVDIQPVSEKDRLGHDFVRMVARFSGLVRTLSENTRNLMTVSEAISGAADETSRGATDQSNQVTQVSTATEQMSATIIETAQNSSEASERSRKANEAAAMGGETVLEMRSGMQKIAEVVQGSAASIAKLSDSANRIGEIVSVINDIADQTNLLALNAAIEAARAGEQGRGFAVVADEVRKLAERTGKATTEISGMIKSVQTDTEAAVGSMESGMAQIGQGQELSENAKASLDEIVAMSQEVMDMIQQIATASEEQSVTADEIQKNIVQVADVARESTGIAERTASTAGQLRRQSEQMAELAGQFEVNESN